jgi:hypothetical protein
MPVSSVINPLAQNLPPGEVSGNIIGGPEFAFAELLPGQSPAPGASAYMGGRPGILRIPVSRDLPNRKIYNWIGTPNNVNSGTEWYFSAVLRFLLGNTQVGQLPLQLGSGVSTGGIYLTQSAICIAAADTYNTGGCPDTIFVSFASPQSWEGGGFGVLRPQHFTGIFDMVQVDLLGVSNMTASRLFVGIMSNAQI